MPPCLRRLGAGQTMRPTRSCDYSSTSEERMGEKDVVETGSSAKEGSRRMVKDILPGVKVIRNLF